MWQKHMLKPNEWDHQAWITIFNPILKLTWPNVQDSYHQELDMKNSTTLSFYYMHHFFRGSCLIKGGRLEREIRMFVFHFLWNVWEQFHTQTLACEGNDAICVPWLELRMLLASLGEVWYLIMITFCPE